MRGGVAGSDTTSRVTKALRSRSTAIASPDLDRWIRCSARWPHARRWTWWTTCSSVARLSRSSTWSSKGSAARPRRAVCCRRDWCFTCAERTSSSCMRRAPSHSRSSRIAQSRRVSCLTSSSRRNWCSMTTNNQSCASTSHRCHREPRCAGTRPRDRELVRHAFRHRFAHGHECARVRHQCLHGRSRPNGATRSRWPITD